MPIQFPDFQRISFDEANPWLVGMERGQKLAQSNMQFPQDMQAKILANQIQQVQAKYSEPNAKADLTTKQQHNQWDPKIWGSEIGLRGSQSGLAQSESNMNNLKLKYLKEYLGGGMGGEGGGGGMGGQSSMPMSGNNGGQPQSQNNSPQGSVQAGGAVGGNQPNANTMYGIEVPQPNRSDIANSMLMGIDTFAPKRENAKLQIQDQYEKFQKTLSESIQEANAGTSMNQAMNVFNESMNKSTYKGQRLGNVPSSGWLTPPFNDMSPEQQADRAALNMLPAAIETLKDAMGNARFSNLDMNMASKMKFDRTMNDETRKVQTQWIHGVNERLQEKSKFYSLMGNPQSGAQKSAADQLWQNYQQDFPLISDNGKTFQGSNLSNWPLYTTPKAIESIKNTGFYSPSAKEKNTYMMMLRDGSIVPIKKGRVESAFKKGARPL